MENNERFSTTEANLNLSSTKRGRRGERKLCPGKQKESFALFIPQVTEAKAG